MLFPYNNLFITLYDLNDNFIDFIWSQLTVLHKDIISVT